jgi:hypothetical protein
LKTKYLYTARYSAGSVAKKEGAGTQDMADGFGHTSTITTKNYTGDTFSKEMLNTVKVLDFLALRHFLFYIS